MPQPDRAPAGGRRVADGVDQVRFNRALRVVNGQWSNTETAGFRVSIQFCVKTPAALSRGSCAQWARIQSNRNRPVGARGPLEQSRCYRESMRSRCPASAVLPLMVSQPLSAVLPRVDRRSVHACNLSCVLRRARTGRLPTTRVWPSPLIRHVTEAVLGPNLRGGRNRDCARCRVDQSTTAGKCSTDHKRRSTCVCVHQMQFILGAGEANIEESPSGILC
jgi:hypothetical protein